MIPILLQPQFRSYNLWASDIENAQNVSMRLVGIFSFPSQSRPSQLVGTKVLVFFPLVPAVFDIPCHCLANDGF